MTALLAVALAVALLALAVRVELLCRQVRRDAHHRDRDDGGVYLGPPRRPTRTRQETDRWPTPS